MTVDVICSPPRLQSCFISGTFSKLNDLDCREIYRTSNNFRVMKVGILVLLCILHGSRASSNVQTKRSASVYPIFGTGGHGSSRSNYWTPSDTSQFLHYLGGQHGGNNGALSHTLYSFVPIQAPSSSHGRSASLHHNSIFDQNLLNAYLINHLSPASTTAAPAASHGYDGSLYSTHYGLLGPNFAHSPAPSSSYTTQQHPSPTISASSLAHTARSSFYAHNNLVNTLLAGSRPQPYTGSVSY